MPDPSEKVTTGMTPKFWTCDPSAELLTAYQIEEAVTEWADKIEDPLPETVTVYGFVERELPPADIIAGWVLEELMEWLDQDFGNQIDGTATDITRELDDAALAFAEIVRREYPVWACKKVCEETVKVADYVPADWLTPSTPEVRDE